MHAPLLAEILRRRAVPDPQEEPPAPEGSQRYLWESRWGSMLSEVKGDPVFVSGVQS